MEEILSVLIIFVLEVLSSEVLKNTGIISYIIAYLGKNIFLIKYVLLHKKKNKQQ